MFTHRFLRLTVASAALLIAQAVATAAGFSVVKDERGVWWFQGPDGSRFYSLGVSNVSPEPFMPREGTKFYNPVPTDFKGDVNAWATATRAMLKEHGFNTLGGWSSPIITAGGSMFTTPVLYVVEHDAYRCLTPLRADFEAFVRTNTKAAIAKLPGREGLLGVFLDNEMPWYGKSGWDDIPTYTQLERAFELPTSDERRTAALKFLQSRHASVAALAEAYQRPIEGGKSWDAIDTPYLQSSSSDAAMADREAFTALLAERFYEVTTRVVREELPGTLILGTRIPGNAPDSVIRACGKYCDVMSVNEYVFEPKVNVHSMTRFWVLGGKPIMHTEFSWRARSNTSGCPNTRGASAIVDTQAERAAAYSSLIEDTATVPYMIASHWFEFADQSPQGRFDGEDGNYGIIDIHNKPYTELLAAMKATNAKVHDLHAKTTRQMPNELPKKKSVTYTPGQHPGRAPTQSLLVEWVREPEIWGVPDSKIVWSRRGEGADAPIVLKYDTGSQYGGGINIFGPKASALKVGPKLAVDLDSYSTIVLDLEAPKGLQLNIVLAEAGSGPMNTTYDMSAGDDGEAYISNTLYGEGKRMTYKVPIIALRRQPFFGNQGGGFSIDMKAIRNLGLQVSGTPREGEVVIHGFSLQR
ncbi:MAG: hypothetical protein SFY96_14320 [Planctomycetota bacterium]|nr:hypothetical protein [Planctomycetota bacterium]